MNPQQKLVVIAGGSAALVLIGITVFFLKRKQNGAVKREEDDEDTRRNELQHDLPAGNTSIASAGQSVVEVKVPPRVVGTIIGKNGSNIKQLRQEFGVRFDFEKQKEDTTNLDISQKSDQTLTIRGQREKVHVAEQRIKRLIAEAPKYVDTEMFVPQEALGRIIGKGGNTIRELNSTSGAKIIVDRDENPALGELRRVKLSGTSSQVDYAKALVEEKVQAEKLFRLQNANKENGKSPPTIKSISSVSLPDKNEYFQVFVSAIESPNHIWVQLVNQDSVKLTELDRELIETYGKLKENEERLESGKVGNLCIAPYSSEGWHRGAITSINVVKRTADIFFLDYGDTVGVNIDQLKKIKSNHLTLPAHAVECYLPINPKPGSTWSDKTLEQVKEMTKCAQWIPLMAKCIGYNELNAEKCPILELVDTKNKDLNVCEEMVRNGETSWDESEALDKRVKEQKSNVQIAGDENKSPAEPLSEVNGKVHTPVTKKDSLDDFIDIDVEDSNGSLSAVLTQRHYEVEEDVAQLETEDEVHAEPELNGHDSTLVDEDTVIENVRDEDVEKTASPSASDREHELQRSLDETSRKNVFHHSMELARENLLTSEECVSQDDNDSFVSARSNVTLTDGDTDNTSFVTAADRLTPVNDISFSIPELSKASSPRGSLNSSSPRGSLNDLSRPIGVDTKPLSGSRMEIQFIDETTHKVVSRESLNTNFEASDFVKAKKVGKETPV